MANLGKKGGVYVARFRYEGKEYKKSLKTTNRGEAENALKNVEVGIHRLTTGLVRVPVGIDPGDFILSVCTLDHVRSNPRKAPTLTTLIDDYLAHQGHLAASYVATQRVHLRNFKKGLPRRVGTPCDGISRDLEYYLQARLKHCKADTVAKERFTLVKLFEWAVANAHIETSPAAKLAPIKGDADKPPFRTVAEIEVILARGGLSD
jgi:hypothetical protein